MVVKLVIDAPSGRVALLARRWTPSLGAEEKESVA
jgi:hypothetical protein